MRTGRVQAPRWQPRQAVQDARWGQYGAEDGGGGVPRPGGPSGGAIATVGEAQVQAEPRRAVGAPKGRWSLDIRGNDAPIVQPCWHSSLGLHGCSQLGIRVRVILEGCAKDHLAQALGDD